jgi:hypothetical protein
MSVSHFIPGGFTVSRRVKSREVPSTLRLVPAPSNDSRVTAGRILSVGRSTPPPAGGRTGVAPLVGEAVTTACERLAALERRTWEVAREFRWNRITSARRGLTELMCGTQALMMLAASAVEATGRDLDRLAGTGGVNPNRSTERVVSQLIADEGSENWQAIARTLERHLIPTLKAWREVFESLIGPFDTDPCGRAA